MIRYDSLPPRFPGAMRMLLERGMISREGQSEAFRTLAQNRQECTDVLAHLLGLRLSIGPDFFSIQSRPAAPDPALAPEWVKSTEPARALATWLFLMWYAEQTSDEKSVLSEIATAIQAEARDTGVEFNWTLRTDRRLLQRAMEHAVSMGYAAIEEGSAEEWADSTGVQDLLVEWRPAIWQDHAPRDEDVRSDLLDRDANPPAPEAFTDSLTPLVRLYRWLLLHPILISEEDPEAFRLLLDDSTSKRVARDLRALFGYELERGDNFARVRSPVADETVSRTSPINLIADESKLAVLVGAEIRKRVSAGDPNLAPVNGTVRVTRDFLHAVIADLQDEYGEHWKADFRSATAPRIMRAVLPRMLNMGIARLPELRGDDTDTDVIITPAAAPLAPYYALEGEN